MRYKCPTCRSCLYYYYVEGVLYLFCDLCIKYYRVVPVQQLEIIEDENIINEINEQKKERDAIPW